MDILIALLFGLLLNLIAAEIYANAPAIANFLIAHAARRIPEQQRERWSEPFWCMKIPGTV